MNEPILSILVVNWNTEELLSNCLKSIYEDIASAAWEVIVVDNNSDDGSLAMLERDFPQVVQVASRENTGFVRGNYLALEKARGRYLLLLNTDTEVECGALAPLVDFMTAHPEAGAVGPKLLNRDGSLQLSCGISPSLATEFTNKTLLHNLFPFFTTNKSSSLNKIFNSGKLRTLFDFDMYFTCTQSHLGFSGVDFGSKYFESLSNCVGSTIFRSVTSISPTIPGGLQFE